MLKFKIIFFCFNKNIATPPYLYYETKLARYLSIRAYKTPFIYVLKLNLYIYIKY